MVLALIPRVKVMEDARHSARFPAQRCADVTLVLRDGTELHSGDVEARGGPEAPLTDSEIEAKLRLFAEPVIGATRTRALWTMRRELLKPGHLFAALSALVTDPPDAIPAPQGTDHPLPFARDQRI